MPSLPIVLIALFIGLGLTALLWNQRSFMTQEKGQRGLRKLLDERPMIVLAIALIPILILCILSLGFIIAGNQLI